MALLTSEEAADLADIKPAQLKLWCEKAEFTPFTQTKKSGMFGGVEMADYFTSGY